MAKKGIQYVVVDAFTAEPFKGHPAAVCFLEDDAAAPTGDGRWMQSVAVEFNQSQTAFLSRDSSSLAAGAAIPRFHLRWFTTVTEVALCGHATLATAHFLFTAVLGERHGVVEFATKSGILTAKKVPAPETEEQGKLFIEMNFPMSEYVGCDPADELPSIPETLNGASVVSVYKSLTTTDFIVELSSGKEDPVCGSAHCVLAPYWGEKLGKQKLIAFQASPRSGTLYLELDVANKRVLIQGEAVTIMSGTLFA
ncbi:hypothetical protein ACQJBY_022255 [Aegilops geniculata]